MFSSNWLQFSGGLDEAQACSDPMGSWTMVRTMSVDHVVDIQVVYKISGKERDDLTSTEVVQL